MELGVRQEQVHVRVAPPRAGLPLAAQLALDSLLVGDVIHITEGRQRRLFVLGRDEDVEVDIERRARLAVVIQRDRPAECVGDAPLRQRHVESDDLLIPGRLPLGPERFFPSHQTACCVGKPVSGIPGKRSPGSLPIPVWTTIRSAYLDNSIIACAWSSAEASRQCSITSASRSATGPRNVVSSAA
jgi:hypothetical protein